jgi:hypothetical protein
MRPIVLFGVIALVLLAHTPSPAEEAQPSGVNVDEVWQAVNDEADTEAAQRAQVLRVLQHPATREVAHSHGLDLAAAEGRARVLKGPELKALSERAALAESQLAGTNGAIVLDTPTIIIGLLILIILILIL